MKNKPIICIPESDKKKRFLLGKSGTKELLAIALNPSTADELELDPTSRNIQILATQNNCDGWYMVNLYPGRTSNPEYLPTTANQSLVNENINFIKNMLTSNDFNITKVLCCWGNTVDYYNYLKESAQIITSILKDHNIPLYCIKMSNAKNPYHAGPRAVNRYLGGIEKVKFEPF